MNASSSAFPASSSRTGPNAILDVYAFGAILRVETVFFGNSSSLSMQQALALISEVGAGSRVRVRGSMISTPVTYHSHFLLVTLRFQARLWRDWRELQRKTCSKHIKRQAGDAG